MLSTMWSLTVPRITFKWSPQTFRSFSLSCVNRQAESEGRRPSRVFYQTLKTYPELFESYAAAGHRVTKELWAKMRAEPELFRARQEEIRYYNDRQRATSLEYRAKHRKQASAYYQAHKRDETYIRSKAMFIWCFCMIDRSKSTWARENLPWKTHIPVQQHEKTYHFCTCCGISRHLKSAWQSKAAPTEFLCQKHYTARGWSAAMPEGYEDVRTFGGLRARYEELNPGSSSKP